MLLALHHLRCKIALRSLHCVWFAQALLPLQFELLLCLEADDIVRERELWNSGSLQHPVQYRIACRNVF